MTRPFGRVGIQNSESRIVTAYFNSDQQAAYLEGERPKARGSSGGKKLIYNANPHTANAAPQMNEKITTPLRFLARNTIHILDSGFWILNSDRISPSV